MSLKKMPSENSVSRRGMTPELSVLAMIAAMLMSVMLILPVGVHADTSKPTKRVVALYSQPLDFPATEMTAQGIREVFFDQSDIRVQVFSEYLDLSRFRNESQVRALAEFLRLKYENVDFDVVISIDSPATSFLIDNSSKVFPNSQLVFSSIPQTLGKKIETLELRKRSTCIIEPANGAQLIHAALSLFPGSTNAAFISGAFENDELRARDLRNSLEKFRGRLNIIDLSGLSREETIRRVKGLPADTLVFFSTFFVDTNGISYVPRDILKSISSQTGHPVFGPYESYLGYGIVGGPLASVRLQGKRAAEVAVEILKGASAGDIPFDYGLGTIVNEYDWNQLRRWEITERSLPPGSTVINRKPSIWEMYKAQAGIALALLIFQSALIMALFVNLHKRKRAEQSLLDSRQDLRILAGRLISSQEDELRRLSREFHDDIAQRLAAAAIEAGTLELKATETEDPNLNRIRSIKDQLINLSEDVHAISREIHPSILKDLGLIRAVKSLCVMFSDRENIPIDLETEEIPVPIDKNVSLCFYRVTQESLRNVSKHANAHGVTVTLKYVQPDLVLKIRDDGKGFVPQGVREIPGIGLASMRERVDYINGRLNISSEPGKGTTVELYAPLEVKPDETSQGSAC